MSRASLLRQWWDKAEELLEHAESSDITAEASASSAALAVVYLNKCAMLMAFPFEVQKLVRGEDQD